MTNGERKRVCETRKQRISLHFSFFSYFKIFFVFSKTLNSLRTTPPDYEISFHYNKIVSREIRSNIAIGFEEAFCSVEALSINARCTDDRSGPLS